MKWLGLVLAVAMAVGTGGCAEMAQGLAGLYGARWDNTTCASNSLQVGHCVPLKQGAK
jgi:hypothetical protein